VLKLIAQKINDNATIPTFAHDTDAAFDLYSPINTTILPGGQAMIPLGIKIKIPQGFYVDFRSRSGLSFKYRISHRAGLIDEDYTRELGLILVNEDNKPFPIMKGDRIAQAVLCKKHNVVIIEGIVEDTARGGFGSSGR